MTTETGVKTTGKIEPIQAALIMRALGVSRSDAVTMVALAMAESGLNASAKGGPNNDGSYDWGVWQINGKTAPVGWFIPYVNGTYAAAKLKTQGFNAWCTYEPEACSGNGNKEYLKHMGAAKTAVDDAWNYEVGSRIWSGALDFLKAKTWEDGTATVGTVDAQSELSKDMESLGLTGFLDSLTSWQLWVRIGLAIMGGLVLLFVLYLFGKQSVAPVIRSVTK